MFKMCGSKALRSRAFRVHEKLYTDRQALYNAEVQTEQTAVYTLDMQLVMLLPR